MPAATISDLLQIPAGTKKPHAYQVFGLEGGEQDVLKIGAAMEETVQRLNAAKTGTDPKLWNQAAKVVKQARAILADPKKKAELDVRFGIIQMDDVPPPPPAAAADPLAGVLPSADPLASVLPTANPLAPAAPPAAVAAPTAPPAPLAPEHASPADAAPTTSAVASPTPLAAMPPGLFGTSGSMDQVSPVQAPVLVKKSKSTGRRRKSVFGGLVFATFALGMIALIGGLIFFLFLGPGELAITSKDGQLTISTKSKEGGETTQISETRRPVGGRPVDPVMGRLGGNVPAPGSTSLEEDLGMNDPTVSPPPVQPTVEPMGSDRPKSDPNMVAATETMPPETMPPETMPAMKPDLPPDSTILPVDPAMEAGPADTEMTEEMVAAGEALLQTTRRAIGGAKWAEMKVAAEKATEATLTDEQREEAESLFQVADLATFYRGGIERGVAGLTVGDVFEVTESLRVIVVEKRQDFLAIRSNAKTFTYTYDELPFVVAHKLATFSLSPDDPSNVAAKAVYQAIAPKSTDAHREEAFSWLESIGGDVEGAEPERVIETIKALFADRPEA